MRKLVRRILYWVRREQAQSDLREEMEFHRLRVQQQLERSGVPRNEAITRSRRALGNTLLAQEDSRAVWIWPWLDRLWQDVRFGVRMIAKNPGFTAVAVISLGLGIGANTAIFTVVNTVYFNPIPVEDISTLYAIGSIEDEASLESFNGLSFPNFEDLRAQSRAFSDIAASTFIQIPWTHGQATIPLRGQAVTANYFELLGVKAVLGRTFLPDEGRTQGQNPAAILSHKTWVEQLGAAPDVIGRQIVLRSQLFTVVGIAPEKFRGMSTVGNPDQVWITSTMLPIVRPDRDTTRKDRSWIAIGRYKPGVNEAQAGSELRNIATELRRQYPDDNDGRNFRMERLWNFAHGTWSGSVMPMVAGMMLTSVGVVLIVVCLNLASLLLARGAHRRREFCVRVALGGSRLRLIRQLLTESILMASIGGTIGVFAAFWTMWYLRPGALEHLGPIELSLDFRVMAFITAITVSAGIFFGLAPAIAATRRKDINPTLHGGGGPGPGATAGMGRQRLSAFLLVMQITFSVVMLISGALFLRVAQAADSVDLGFEWKNIGEAGVNVLPAGYSPAEGSAFYREAVARVAAIRGVEAAALFCGRGGEAALAEHDEHIPGYRPPAVANASVSPNFFSTLRVPVTSGRGFTEADREGTIPVAVINRSVADRLWPGKDPIGKRFHFKGDPVMREVVGVVPNFGSFTQIPVLTIYLPFEQAYAPACTFRFRAENPGAMLSTIRTAILDIDSDVQITVTRTIQDIVTGNFTKMRVVSFPLEAAGLFTLALSVIGIYGVTAYSVAQRIQELGLRAALGGRRAHLLWVVVWRGLRCVVLGIILGVGIAGFLMPRVFFSRFLMNGIQANDPLAFVGAALVVLAAGLLASYIPARRATSVDPVIALRYE
jgi:predicted permease